MSQILQTLLLSFVFCMIIHFRRKSRHVAIIQLILALISIFPFTNIFYFYRSCTYIVFILKYQKVQNYLKRAEVIVFLIILMIFSSRPHLYCYRFLPFTQGLHESDTVYYIPTIHQVDTISLGSNTTIAE